MGQSELILISIFKACKGEKKPVEFENVVVEAFKIFPNIFHLKGFKAYPDSAKIEKRIYDRLKPNGFVITAGRKVEMTEYGMEKARFLVGKMNGVDNIKLSDTLTDRELLHYRKLLGLDGFILFSNDNNSKLLDVDIYEFYNISARTNLLEIKGKIKIINDLLEKLKKHSVPNINELIDYKSKIDKLMKELSIYDNLTN